MNKLEKYIIYMKDHVMIYKFIIICPMEKDLIKWIQRRWHPKGHIELKLGVRKKFTVIFSNLQDKERFFENGPYLYHNAGLFMRY